MLEQQRMLMDNMNVQPECRGCDHDPSRGLRPAVMGAHEDGIGRRTFLIQSGILTAIAALSACGGLGGGEITAPNVNSTINISDYPALANIGGVAIFTLGSAPLAVVRTAASTFLALSRVCPHQGGTVQRSGNDFVCPVHGATYDLTGQWIGGQRASSLHQYTTTYDASAGTLAIS